MIFLLFIEVINFVTGIITAIVHLIAKEAAIGFLRKFYFLNT